MVLSSGLDGRRRDFQVGKNIVCNLTEFFLLPCLVEYCNLMLTLQENGGAWKNTSLKKIFLQIHFAICRNLHSAIVQGKLDKYLLQLDAQYARKFWCSDPDLMGKEEVFKGSFCQERDGERFSLIWGAAGQNFGNNYLHLYFYRIRIGNSSWEDSSTILHALNSSSALDWARHKQCTS